MAPRCREARIRAPVSHLVTDHDRLQGRLASADRCNGWGGVPLWKAGTINSSKGFTARPEARTRVDDSDRCVQFCTVIEQNDETTDG